MTSPETTQAEQVIGDALDSLQHARALLRRGDPLPSAVAGMCWRSANSLRVLARQLSGRRLPLQKCRPHWIEGGYATMKERCFR